MKWELPKSVEIDGVEHKIRNDCDYRVVLDVISALNDKELDEQSRVQCALFIFYEDLSKITDIQTAVDEMMKIINCGEEKEDKSEEPKPKLMDWEHDWHLIAPPISRILGYDVRDPDKYTHWYTLIGAYMEIGDCYFAQILSIRSKKMKGKKLDETDRQFYKEHKKDIDLPMKLSEEDKDWLDSDW